MMRALTPPTTTISPLHFYQHSLQLFSSYSHSSTPSLPSPILSSSPFSPLTPSISSTSKFSFVSNISSSPWRPSLAKTHLHPPPPRPFLQDEHPEKGAQPRALLVPAPARNTCRRPPTSPSPSPSPYLFPPSSRLLTERKRRRRLSHPHSLPPSPPRQRRRLSQTPQRLHRRDLLLRITRKPP